MDAVVLRRRDRRCDVPAAGARVIPSRILLQFEVGTPPAEMGRQVALLVLESLHHLSGDLAENVRLALGSTVRLPALDR